MLFRSKMIDIEYFINFSEKILFENYYLTHYHTIKMFKKLKENIHSENARKILYEYVDDIKTHYNYCAQKLGFPSSSNLHKTNYLYRSLFDLPFIFYVMFISIIIVFLLLFIYILIIFLESGLLKGTINF